MVVFPCLIWSALLAASHCIDVQLFEGDNCKNSGGGCTAKSKYPRAVQEAKQNNHHDESHCGFENFTEIVCCPFKNQKNPLITGGLVADPNQFPHMMALGFHNKPNDIYEFNCGGFLISDKFVVTSAHCVANFDQNRLKFVQMGAVIVPLVTNEMDSFYDYNIINIFIHPNFTRKPSVNDIAVVELDGETTLNKHFHLPILYTMEDDPEELMVTGWGKIEMDGPSSIILQKASKASVWLHKCAKKFLQVHQHVSSSDQICALSPKDNNCKGDSGGPLYVEEDKNAKLVGVVSFGSVCDDKVPGVYTKISNHLDWIESIVWSD